MIPVRIQRVRLIQDKFVEFISPMKGYFKETCKSQNINPIYQSPLVLTELFQHNLINVSYLTACYLYQVMMTLHFFE